MLLGMRAGSPVVSPIAEAAAFFERLSSQPTNTRKLQYNDLISGLVRTGVWAKLDVFYVLAAADATTARTNLISSSFSATVTGSPTFAADQGYTGTGATSAYLSSGFNPTVGTPNFSQNSASFFAWKNTAPVGDAGLLIAPVGESNYLQVYRPTDSFQWQVNSGGTAVNGISLTAQTGLMGASRTASNVQYSYYGGTPLTKTTTASSAPANAVYRFVGDGSATTTSQVSAVVIGGGLTAANVRNLNAYLTKYMNALAGVTPTVSYGYSSDIVNDGANNFGPGLGRLIDGRLICVYSVGSGLGVDAALYYRTSSDDGLTWSSAASVVAPSAGRNLDYARITVLANGDILVSYVDQANNGSGNTAKIIKGTTSGGAVTWSALATVTSGTIANPAPAGPPLQLANGNLLIALTSLSGVITTETSTDNGATWGSEQTVVNDLAKDYGFLTLVQKNDGSLFGVLRGDSSTTADKGYWTITCPTVGGVWTSPVQIFQTANANEASLVLTPGGTLMLMGRWQDGTGQDGDYTYSTDGGTTWAARTRFYGYGNYSLGGFIESQGFYDSKTRTVMWAVGQGTFTSAGTIVFQQFIVN